MTQSILLVCPSCGTVNRIPEERPASEAKCGRCHQRLFAGKPMAVDAKGFEQQITRNDIPVIVDFWAPWCGPCLAMTPALEHASSELEPRFRILKVNVDQESGLAARFNVRSIPTLMLFAGGRPTARNAGAMTAHDIVAWVRANKP
jgi:thioredoxin 2